MENLSTYSIKDRISDSRWTTLFTAVHKVTGQKVIVKFFNLKGSLQKSIGTEKEVNWRKRFALEAKIMEAADHPNVIPVLGHGNIPDGRPCLVMPFINANLTFEIGQDISDPRILARLAPPRRPKPTKPDRAYHILEQMLSGLGHLHKMGVVHRDLKPGNILMTRRSGGRAILCDFGMAKWGEHIYDNEDEMIGSRGYISPEQKKNPASVDATTDVFTVGLIAFRMLTAFLPVDGETSVRARGAKVSEGVDRLVSACLSRDPSDRPDDAGIMLSELNKVTGRK